MRGTPIATGAQPRSRSEWAIVAAATNIPPMHAPKAAPDNVQSGALPGSRCAANKPATPPANTEPDITARIRCSSGSRNTLVRETGASRRCATSAASIDTGPPSVPLRSPPTRASTTSKPSTAGPWAKASAAAVALSG